MVRKSFGHRLRAARLKANVGLRELAREVKLSPTYISQIELGIIEKPAWDQVMRIARCLKAPDLFALGIEGLQSDIAKHQVRLKTMSEELKEKSESDEIFRDMRQFADAMVAAFDEAMCELDDALRDSRKWRSQKQKKK
jgi:transcriptional regulator with XRE-family HTH domain